MRLTIEIGAGRILWVDLDRLQKWTEFDWMRLPAGLQVTALTEEKPKPRRFKATWVGSALELYEKRHGVGSANGIGFGRLGRAFKRLIQAQGVEPVLAAWGRYLDRTEGQFQSPENFVRRYDEFARQPEKRRTPDVLRAEAERRAILRAAGEL